MPNKSDPGKIETPINIHHYIPENVLGIYSDGAQVMHTKNEFIVTFFQIEHPVWPMTADAPTIDSVKSRCVARIIMSPQQMLKLVQALNENLSKFIASQSANQSEETEHGE